MRVGSWFAVGVALASCGAPQGTGDAGPPTDAQDEPAACAQGQTRCTDTLLGVETCDATGHWSDPAPCASQTCVAGACAGQCSAGQTQCSGTSVQTCDGSGSWAVTQTCPVACCDATCVDTANDTNNCGTCGNACGAGYGCGTTFTAFTGTQSANWNANGTATYDAANQAAQLTETATSTAGTWIYAHALVVDDATFDFDFYAGGGTGADGLAFALETTAPNALGVTGGGFGVAGLAGFGVEFDSYDNAECSDDTANHTAIDALTPCGAGEPTSLVVNDSPGFTVADGAWHHVDVHVASGAFSVTTDSIDQFTSYTPAGWTNGKYWLAFGGGNGGETDVHEVRNVERHLRDAALLLRHRDEAGADRFGHARVGGARPDDDARREIDVVLAREREQEPGQRRPAPAAGRPVVVCTMQPKWRGFLG